MLLSYQISRKRRNDEGRVDEESSPPHPSLPQLLLEGLEDHQPDGDARQAAPDMGQVGHRRNSGGVPPIHSYANLEQKCGVKVLKLCLYRMENRKVTLVVYSTKTHLNVPFKVTFTKSLPHWAVTAL